MEDENIIFSNLISSNFQVVCKTCGNAKEIEINVGDNVVIVKCPLCDTVDKIY